MTADGSLRSMMSAAALQRTAVLISERMSSPPPGKMALTFWLSRFCPVNQMPTGL